MCPSIVFMRNALVLFFAADPHSAPPDGREPRLLLDEDVRQVRRKVRAVDYRRVLQFDVWWAPRTDDLMEALDEIDPEVVHFSGHGGSKGLVLVADDGYGPHAVGGDVLRELFEEFPGKIRVVVLSACSSYPHAAAISDVVGCAIGFRGRISDAAARTFNAWFYRALVVGHSVQGAHRQGRLALKLKGFPQHEWPELVVRPDVDASKLIVVRAPLAPRIALGVWQVISQGWEWIATALVGLLSLAGAKALGVAVGMAVVLSLVPLFVTGGLLRFSRSAAGRGVIRPWCAAVSAVGVSVGVVLAGSSLATYRDLGRAKAHYAAEHHVAALPIFQRLAEAGNTEAMRFLGIMQMTGQGTPPQDVMGSGWLSLAAERGDADAMYVLGIAYETDKGVTKSEADAVRMYRAAQLKGHVEAANKLGEMYRQGTVVNQSYDSALIWYVAAADGGSVDGMVNAALMHELGKGVTVDLGAARQLYERAARAGSTRAMVHLGRMAETAEPPDFDKAVDLYAKAAEAKDADAMNNLGVLYASGRGVPRQDLAEAAAWFDSAAALRSTDAVENRRRLDEALLPRAQRPDVAAPRS
jgi:TPR repeat protein